MRIALIALPWTAFDRPSAAIGLLGAWLRAQRPGWEVSLQHPHVELYASLGELYEPIADDGESVGEVVFAPALWPAQREGALDALVAWGPRGLGRELSRAEAAHVIDAALDFADATARGLAAEPLDVIGFTTTYAQLHASLAVARRVKALRPEVRVVLGGVGVGWHLGQGVLDEFAEVDAIVQGEGEDRLVSLLDAWVAGLEAPDLDGILARGRRDARQGGDTVGRTVMLAEESRDLDALPYPDYDDYAARADAHSIQWLIPLEGSRGCWWDRVKRTGDATKTCAFCSLQSVTYREKSPERLAAEVDALVGRYRTPHLFFLDNVLRAKGVEALCDALDAKGRTLRFFHEARVNVTPWELLRLWEAGCESLQFGIEALCTSVLDKLGKGTTAILNLQAMRFAAELGISSMSNLIVGFPGTTDDEVAQTVEVIDRFASAYPPCNASSFMVGIQSAVHRDPKRYGIRRIRNARFFEGVMPPEVYARLPLFALDEERESPGADWSPVVRALDAWRARYQTLRDDVVVRRLGGVRPLHYHDGGDFLEIVDRRGEPRTVTLDGALRVLYLRATEACRLRELHTLLADSLSADEVDASVAALVEANVMFQEGDRVLSLAVAHRPSVAARRIRAMHDDRKAVTRARRVALPVAR